MGARNTVPTKLPADGCARTGFSMLAQYGSPLEIKVERELTSDSTVAACLLTQADGEHRPVLTKQAAEEKKIRRATRSS